MKRTLIGIIALLLLSGLTACKRKQIDSLEGILHWEVLQIDSTYIDPYVLENWDNVEGLDTPSCKINIKLSYPLFTRQGYSDIRDSIVKLQAEHIYSAPISDFTKEGLQAYLNGYVEEQMKDYQLDLDEAKKFIDFPYSVFNREIEYSDSIVFAQKGILSILTRAFTYSGGAHGNYLISTINYDLNKKELITPSSLFEDPTDSRLIELLLDKLMEAFEVKTPDELEYIGVFSYHALEVTGNFEFSSQGITFNYNPYELAAYSLGPIQLQLSYEELNPYFSAAYKGRFTR